jgi:predicted Rossmann fold nucleotide-binding protein DprA/Smf involved in DNA uptake
LAQLLDRMAPGEAYALDDLAGMTGINGARLLPRLMELELQGTVSSAGGRFLRRLTRSPGYGVR